MPRVETIVPAATAASENTSVKSESVYGGTVLRLPASHLVSRTNARPGDAPADEAPTKHEKKEDKKPEEAAAGLGSLFG